MREKQEKNGKGELVSENPDKYDETADDASYLYLLRCATWKKKKLAEKNRSFRQG